MINHWLLLILNFIFQLSEMTADLGEEHSAATLATERLEAEQAERMKLQKDNTELQVIKNRLYGS